MTHSKIVPLGCHCNVTFVMRQISERGKTGLFEFVESKKLAAITAILRFVATEEASRVEEAPRRSIPIIDHGNHIGILSDQVFTYHYTAEQYKSIFERRLARFIEDITDSDANCIFIRIDAIGFSTSKDEVCEFLDMVESMQRQRRTAEQRQRRTAEERERRTAEERERRTAEERERGAAEERERRTAEERERGAAEERGRGAAEQRGRGAAEERGRGAAEHPEKTFQKMTFLLIETVVDSEQYAEKMLLENTFEYFPNGRLARRFVRYEDCKTSVYLQNNKTVSEMVAQYIRECEHE